MNSTHPRAKRITVIVLLALVVLTFSLYLAAKSRAPSTVQPTPQRSSGSTQPKISWSPKSVEATLSPGESASRNLTFTSDQALQNVVLEPVPEIARFLVIQPNTFASVLAGQPQAVRLSFTIPTGTALGTYEGTVHLRTGSQTLPQTLKIFLNVWQFVAEKGLALKYPPAWQRNPRLLDLNDPISLNTFASAYKQGGFIPKGSAEIDIATTPLPTSTLRDLIAKELVGATIQSTETITIAGSGATRVFYTDSYAPALSYKNVAVYLPRGALLYKFFLSYYTGDLREAQFLADFQQILETVQFTK